MKKRKLGNSGLEISPLVFGRNVFGWTVDEATSGKLLSAFVAGGFNAIDTADTYSRWVPGHAGGESETIIGKWMKQSQNRDKVIVATKVGMEMGPGRKGLSKSYILRSAEDSLRRLQTDYIDLYQLHKPDDTTPLADSLGALDELVRAGKVREIGCSNFSKTQLLEAAAVVNAGGARFVSVQNNYSLMHREPEPEVLPECERQGLAFLPYFPLANGLLSGKYRAGQAIPAGSRGSDGFGPKVFTEANLGIVEKLMQFAESRGHSLLDLANSWLAARPAVASVIAGAKTPDQVRTNAAAVGWKLTAAELSAIDALAPRTA